MGKSGYMSKGLKKQNYKEDLPMEHEHLQEARKQLHQIRNNGKGQVIFMKKGLKRILKVFGCIVMAAVLTLTGLQMPNVSGDNPTVMIAEAASTTNRVPMWAYMKNGSGRLTTYTTSALNQSTGYIEPGDYCKILAFYSNGAVKVSYPTASRGMRVAYAPMSGFMVSTSFSGNTRTLGARLTAYRRSIGNATIGTVFATDQVIVIGTANGRTQVAYPCQGGYKLGWVSGTYSSNAGSNPQGYVDSVTSASSGKITVRGWAFDRDSLGSNLQIHVYVGGPAGSGAPAYAITANAYRPDVNNVYKGVGNYHGYNSTISVSRTGTQTVYIYAINVGGGNTNPLLGTKTVNIIGAPSSSGNTSYTTKTVRITSNGQTVDTFNGVPAKYIIGLGNSNTGVYCCAGYVSSYYKSVYGVTVANMFTGRTPSASSGYFYLTSNPKPGDIGYQLNSSNSGHWFIIKSVNGDGTFTIIEQNWKWKSNNVTYCYQNRKVSYSATKGFKVFRWSKRTN